MGIKKFFLVLPLMILLSLILSCGTEPEIQDTVQAAAPEITEQREVIPGPVITEQAAIAEQAEAEEIEAEQELVEYIPEEEVFNPDSISEVVYTRTLAEVQTLIAELNRIIRAQNYNLWTTFLSESYYNEINSRAFLEARADELFRRDQVVASARGVNPNQVQRRNLANARDYFIHIVVPSRQNDRVDDITFITDNQVIAYTVDARGNRLILYNLEVINNEWKIVN